MDLITQGLTKQFQSERGLDALKDDEAFEAFAGFCVLSQFYEDDFDADEFRMGAGGDLGIDVAAVIVNGELLHDAADVRDVVAQAKDVRVRFVVVQAKTSTKFETKVFTDLGDNLVHLFTAPQLTYPCSPEVLNLRACIEAVYADATRGAWHNPGRDRGRIIATATVTSPIRRCAEPIEIAGMRFHSECRLRIEGVVPYPGGVELQPLVPRLAVFPKPHVWSVYLRRALVTLPEQDAALLEDAITPLLTGRAQALATYPGVTPAAAN